LYLILAKDERRWPAEGIKARGGFESATKKLFVYSSVKGKPR